MRDTYQDGKTVIEALSPGMEAMLAAGYDARVPGLSRSTVDIAYEQHCAQTGLGLHDRYRTTIDVLTALGGQTTLNSMQETIEQEDNRDG